MTDEIRTELKKMFREPANRESEDVSPLEKNKAKRVFDYEGLFDGGKQILFSELPVKDLRRLIELGLVDAQDHLANFGPDISTVLFVDEQFPEMKLSVDGMFCMNPRPVLIGPDEKSPGEIVTFDAVKNKIEDLVPGSRLINLLSAWVNLTEGADELDLSYCWFD